MYKSHADTSQNVSVIPSPDCQARVPSGCMAHFHALEMHWSQWQETNSFTDFQLGLCHLSLNFHSEFRSNSLQACKRAQKENLVVIPGYQLEGSPKSKRSILQSQYYSLSCQGQLSMFNEDEGQSKQSREMQRWWSRARLKREPVSHTAPAQNTLYFLTAVV